MTLSNTTHAAGGSGRFYTRLRRNWRRFQSYGTSLLADDTEDLCQSIGLKENTLPRMTTLSIMLLSTATFAFIGWSAITPVKELARVEGQVVPSGYNQLVQHLEGGLVQEILVKEGDFVQQGKTLLRLTGSGAEEDLREQEVMISALMLQRERLKALLEKRAVDFEGIQASPELIDEQQRMMETTMEARSGERVVLERQIAQKKQGISRLQGALQTARTNRGVSSEALSIFADLEQKGMAARTAFLSRQQEYNSRHGEVINLEQQIMEARKELEEYQERLKALSAQQRDNSYTELHKVEAQLAQSQENLKKRQGRMKRLEVTSPVMGYVKGLKLNTVGAVIPAGQTLMEIVPVDEQLVVEARIPTEEIGRLTVDQEVQVKIDSYDYVRFGTIEGKITALSAMTFTDEHLGKEYYKARIMLNRNYAGSVPGMYRVIPGMTVDVDIVTGEKTILAYLLKPVRSALHNSLTEE